AQLVGRIVAVLADQQDRIDGQRLAAQAEGFVDRLEQRNSEAPGSIAGHVVLWKLIGIERNDIDSRIDSLAPKQIGAHQVDQEVVSVRAMPQLGKDCGYLGPCCLLSA